MKNKQAFTLIELLVVVLIIGILAAVAVPQYQKAVEKSRMTEAIMILQNIGRANQIFFMANGRYATLHEMDLLDIEIPGIIDTSWSGNRIRTKHFIYSPAGSGDGGNIMAIAQHVPQNGKQNVYYFYVSKTEPDRVRCTPLTGANATQRQLCSKLNSNGTL